MILGGYLKNINALFQRNNGLKRRFPTQVKFYSLAIEDSFNVLEEEIKIGNLITETNVLIISKKLWVK